MDGLSIGSVLNTNPQVEPGAALSGAFKGSDSNLAEQMKNIRKGRLNRQVYEDPSLASKLVATKASPVYNASGALIQAVSSNLGNV